MSSQQRRPTTPTAERHARAASAHPNAGVDGPNAATAAGPGRDAPTCQGGGDLEVCVEALLELAPPEADVDDPGPSQAAPGGPAAPGGLGSPRPAGAGDVPSVPVEPPAAGGALERTLAGWSSALDLAALYVNGPLWSRPEWAAHGLDPATLRAGPAHPLRAWAARPDEDGLLALRLHPCWPMLGDTTPFLDGAVGLDRARLDYIVRFAVMPPGEVDGELRAAVAAAALSAAPMIGAAAAAAVYWAGRRAAFELVIQVAADVGFWRSLSPPGVDLAPLRAALDPMRHLRDRLPDPQEGVYALAQAAADPGLVRRLLAPGALDALSDQPEVVLQAAFALEHGGLPPDREHFVTLHRVRSGLIVDEARLAAEVATLPPALVDQLGRDRLSQLARWGQGGRAATAGAALDQALDARYAQDASAKVHGDALEQVRSSADARRAVDRLARDLREAADRRDGELALSACTDARARLREAAPPADLTGRELFVRAAFALVVQALEAGRTGLRTWLAAFPDPHHRRRLAQALGREHDGVGQASAAVLERRQGGDAGAGPDQEPAIERVFEEAAGYGAALAEVLPGDPPAALSLANQFFDLRFKAKRELGFVDAEDERLRAVLLEAFQARSGPLGAVLDGMQDFQLAEKIVDALGFRSIAQLLGRDRAGVDPAVVDAEYRVERDLRAVFRALVQQDGGLASDRASSALSAATDRHTTLAASPRGAAPSDEPLPYLLHRYHELFGISLAGHAGRAGLASDLQAALGPFGPGSAPLPPASHPEPAVLGDRFWSIEGAPIAGVSAEHTEADKVTATQAHVDHLATQLDTIRGAWLSTDAAENELSAHQGQLARAGGLARVLDKFQRTFGYSVTFALRELHAMGRVADATVDGAARVENDAVSPHARELLGEADAGQWTLVFVTVAGLEKEERADLLADKATLAHLRDRVPDETTWDLLYRSLQGTVDDSEWIRERTWSQALGLEDELDAGAIFAARDAGHGEEERRSAQARRLVSQDTQAALDRREGGRGWLASWSGADEDRTAAEYRLVGEDALADLVPHHDDAIRGRDQENPGSFGILNPYLLWHDGLSALSAVQDQLEALSEEDRERLRANPQARHILEHLTEHDAGARRELFGLLADGTDSEVAALEAGRGTGVDWTASPLRAAAHLASRTDEERSAIAHDRDRRQAFLDATRGDPAARAHVEALLRATDEAMPTDVLGERACAPAGGPQDGALFLARWTARLAALTAVPEARALRELVACARAWGEAPGEVRGDPDVLRALIRAARPAYRGLWAHLDDEPGRLFERALREGARTLARSVHLRLAKLPDPDLRRVAADPTESRELLAMTRDEKDIHAQVAQLLDGARRFVGAQVALDHARAAEFFAPSPQKDEAASRTARAEQEERYAERALFVSRWVARIGALADEEVEPARRTLQALEAAVQADLGRMTAGDLEGRNRAVARLAEAANPLPADRRGAVGAILRGERFDGRIDPIVSFAMRLIGAMPGEDAATYETVLAEVEDREIAERWASFTHPSFNGYAPLADRVLAFTQAQDEYTKAREEVRALEQEGGEAPPGALQRDLWRAQREVANAEGLAALARDALVSHPVDLSQALAREISGHAEQDESAAAALHRAVRARISKLPTATVYHTLGVAPADLPGLVWTPGNRALLSTADAFDALNGRIQTESVIDPLTRGDDDAATLALAVGDHQGRFDLTRLSQADLAALGARGQDLLAVIEQHSATKQAVTTAVTTYVTVAAAVVGTVVGTVLTAGLGAPALVGGLATVLVSAGGGAINVLMSEALLGEAYNASEAAQEVATDAVVEALMALLTAGVSKGLTGLGAAQLAREGLAPAVVRSVGAGVNSTALSRLGAGLGAAEAAALAVATSGAESAAQAGLGALVGDGDLDGAYRAARDELRRYVQRDMTADGVKALVQALLNKRDLDLGAEPSEGGLDRKLSGVAEEAGTAMRDGLLEDVAGLAATKLNDQVATGSSSVDVADLTAMLQTLAASGSGAVAEGVAGDAAARVALRRRAEAARELETKRVVDPVQRQAYLNAAGQDPDVAGPGGFDLWATTTWEPAEKALRDLTARVDGKVSPQTLQAFRARVHLGQGHADPDALLRFQAEHRDFERLLARQHASAAYRSLSAEERAWYDHAAQRTVHQGQGAPPDLMDPAAVADLRQQVSAIRQDQITSWNLEILRDVPDRRKLSEQAARLRRLGPTLMKDIDVLPGQEDAARARYLARARPYVQPHVVDEAPSGSWSAPRGESVVLGR